MSDADKKTPTDTSPPEGAQITFFTVLASVFRAWFGVQKEVNRQRDFNSNNPMAFIIAGIIFFLVMIIAVIITVKVVLA